MNSDSSWHPNEKENEYLRLVLSMTADCILGHGTVDRHTYTSNLRTIATAIDHLGGKNDGPNIEKL